VPAWNHSTGCGAAGLGDLLVGRIGAMQLDREFLERPI